MATEIPTGKCLKYVTQGWVFFHPSTSICQLFKLPKFPYVSIQISFELSKLHEFLDILGFLEKSGEKQAKILLVNIFFQF